MLATLAVCKQHLTCHDTQHLVSLVLAVLGTESACNGFAGVVAVVHIPGVCSHPAAADGHHADAEHRQFDRQLHCLARRVPRILHPQLDIPVLHGEELCPRFRCAVSQMLEICPPVSDFFCLLSLKLSDRSSVRITCSTLLHHSLPCVPARLVTSAHALLCMCSVARGPVANRLVRRLLLLLFQKLASQQQAQAARMK